MKSVSVKEWRLLQQWLNTTIGWTTWADMLNLDKELFKKAAKALDDSELYQKIWGEIQKKAEEIVKEKCEPEWKRISEEMQPIWEKANALSKEKAEAKEWEWTEEKETKLVDLNKQISELSNQYQKVTDDANKELNEFKDKRINEEQWWCFILEDDEYNIIGKYVWWTLPTKEN
jgi:hypothetical protein